MHWIPKQTCHDMMVRHHFTSLSLSLFSWCECDTLSIYAVLLLVCLIVWASCFFVCKLKVFRVSKASRFPPHSSLPFLSVICNRKEYDKKKNTPINNICYYLYLFFLYVPPRPAVIRLLVESKARPHAVLPCHFHPILFLSMIGNLGLLSLLELVYYFHFRILYLMLGNCILWYYIQILVIKVN